MRTTSHPSVSNRRRQILLAGAALAGGAALPATALAQAAKPTTLVVGYPAGGGTDALARLLGQRMAAARSGLTVVVENRAGASGTIANTFVAKAVADGSTLLVAPVTIITAPHVMAKDAQGATNVLTDLVPVAQLTDGTIALVVHSSVNAKTAKELVAYLKQQPPGSYGSSGSGTPMHIAGELFKKSSGVDIAHVPYKGSGPSMADLAGGHIKVVFADVATATPFVQAGQARILGVVHKTRSAILPDIPTLTEQGVPGVEIPTWFGVFAPKGTPPAVVDALNRDINQAMSAPEVRQRLQGLGESVVAKPPKQFADLVKTDFDFYGGVVTEFGIKVE